VKVTPHGFLDCFGDEDRRLCIGIKVCFDMIITLVVERELRTRKEKVRGRSREKNEGGKKGMMIIVPTRQRD